MSIERIQSYVVEATTADDLRKALIEEIQDRITDTELAVRKAKRPVQSWLSLQRGMLTTLKELQKFLNELIITPKESETPNTTTNIRLVD